jgi:hypothetical protein
LRFFFYFLFSIFYFLFSIFYWGIYRATDDDRKQQGQDATGRRHEEAARSSKDSDKSDKSDGEDKMQQQNDKSDRKDKYIFPFSHFPLVTLYFYK